MYSWGNNKVISVRILASRTENILIFLQQATLINALNTSLSEKGAQFLIKKPFLISRMLVDYWSVRGNWLILHGSRWIGPNKKEFRETADPEGFDPSICGSEDHCDILTTLRTLLSLMISGLNKKYRCLLFRIHLLENHSSARDEYPEDK